MKKLCLIILLMSTLAYAGTVTEFPITTTATTATGPELNYVHGVTSAIQTQLDGKQAVFNPISTATIIGRNTAGDGAAEILPVSTVKTMLGLGTAAYTASTDYLGATAKAADADTLDTHDTSYFQVALSLLAGTYTDGNLCTYASSGTLLNCNTATSTFEPALGNPGTTGWVLSSTDAGVRSWVAQSGGYTNLTSFVDQTAWRVFYSNTDGDITELALGSDGTYLRSNGATSAPTWDTPSGAAHDAVTLSTDLGNNLLGLSTQQVTLDNQAAAYVFAGPTTGDPAAPAFRALVSTDIPDLSGTYLGVSAKAADADTLDTHDTSYFQVALTDPIVAAGAQSITGAKTFDSSMLVLKGSSTGTNTFAAANSSASNYTTTVPAETGTLCTTGSVCSGYQGTVTWGTGLAAAGATASVDTTEIDGNRTWGAADGASITWTWNLTANDPSMVFGPANIQMNANLNLGADDSAENLDIHSGGTFTIRDASDDTSVVFGPVTNGTTVLPITGTLSPTGFYLASTDADPAAAAGAIRHDSTITGFTNGGVVYYNGAVIKQLVDMTTATAQACTDDQVVSYDADNDLWYCKDDANSGSATAINDIADAAADGTIDQTGYKQTFTSTLNTAGSVWTMTNTTADLTADVSFLDLKYTDDGDANGYFLRGYDNAGGDLKFSIGADGAATFGAVTAASYAGPLTGTPTFTLSDSDNAPGTGTINANSGGGANDIILTIGVEDSTGEGTPYIEVDGVTETVDILKPLALSTNSITMTGSLAATGARVTKGWFTDVESTNMPTVGGTALLSSLTAPVFSTSIEAPFLVVGSAATAADAGAIRLPNAGYIYSEADAAGTDISVIGVDSAEIVQIGASGASGVTVTPTATLSGGATVPTGQSVALAGTTYIAGGADPADSGFVRMSNNTALAWEQSTPGTDIYIALDSSDVLQVGQNAASIALGTSGTGNVSVTGDLTVTGAGIQLGATGVNISSDNDGAITFLGSSAGYDEDFTINLDDTENSAVVSSSTGLLGFNFSGLSISTTGTLQGNVIFNAYTAAQTLTAAAHNGSVVQMTTADEVTIWDCETAGVGQFVTLWARDAEKIEVVPASGDHFVLFNGTALTADYELDMAATAGTKVTLMCTADDTWSVYNETAASTDGGAAD